jgi:DNA transposition AAA+ family ATPase
MKALKSTGKSAAANDVAQARNDLLAERLFDYQRRNGLSDEQLGKKLASSGTYVSRFRNHSAESPFMGDLVKFEVAIEQLLLREELIQDDQVELTEHGYCVAEVFAFLDLIANQRQMGVGYGPAGKGKTCAAKLYAIKHVTAVYVHVHEWGSTKEKFAVDLARAAGVRKMKRESIFEALARSMKNADRLILIDNANRLTEGTRRFLADFYDYTHNPIALIGNPEIVDQFSRNEQHGSRLGRCVDVTHIADRKTTVLHLLRSYLPSAATDPSVQKTALDILTRNKGGAARAVKMNLCLAQQLLTSGTVSPGQAMQLAQTQLQHQEAA